MNIVFISNESAYTSTSFGGAESSLQLMAEKFSNRGHSVYYVTRAVSVNSKIKQINNIKLHVLPRIKGQSKLKVIRLLNDLIMGSYLKKIIKKQKTDIIYCYYESDIITSLLKTIGTLRYPKIVMRMAGLLWYEQSKKSNDMLQRFNFIFNRIDSANYIHSGLKDLTEIKFTELKMNVKFKDTFNLDIGSSFTYKRQIEYSELGNKEFCVLMATRFSNYQKRQDILVKAISLIDENIKIKIKLIGNGSKREEIQNMIDDLNLNNKVEIVPFMEQHQLWQEMQKSDLLCHACDYEGLGKIIIESMAMGLPVLASKVKPLSDYIEEGVTGFLVDNTPEAWANKIIELIDKRAERIYVSQESIKFIHINYNPDKNIIKYEEKFKEIIDKIQ